MNSAEFRCLYEYLGLTRDWLTQSLKVDSGAIALWDDGIEPVPDSAAVDVKGIADMTSQLVHELAMELQWGGTITTYRTGTEFRANDPFGLTYPVSWHRALVARVADRTADVRIVYHGEG